MNFALRIPDYYKNDIDNLKVKQTLKLIWV